ncbi:MAG: sigma-54-dependent Fis family transcriptional regulator [Deltaproteobacteria bacterium]|nr:sigma-54-dependent Fis family transcriptional regulator [Deltaproteobacteria bacterium]
MDLMITDGSHSETQDTEWVRKVKEFDPLTEVILVDQNPPRERMIHAVKEGAYDFLPLPIDLKALLRSIREIDENRRLRHKVGELQNQLEEAVVFHGIVARSPVMLEIFSMIRRLAKHFTTVLITGETGTGKEMVARALHELSPRRGKNFIACNCSALVETLLESELFGHVKGAFTGAIRTKHGLFEVADGGTIFLDEIGELSPQTQVKLLRVLQNQEVKRVGSNETIQVDARVVTATNQDLVKGMQEGRFREDLYYRLNTAEIYLPPLRERREDIPLLVKHFLSAMNQKLGKKIKGITRQAQIALLNYPWKGNVRELENVIERASLLASKDFITLTDLPSHLQQFTNPVRSSESIPLDMKTLEEVEGDHIRRVMKNVSGNKTVAARILGVSRRSLYRKFEKYKL